MFPTDGGAAMPLNQSIVRWLGVSRWPVFLRHPVIKLLLKRKRLGSFPFRVRLDELLYDGDAANLIDYHVLTRGGFEPGLDQLLADWSRYRGGQDKVFVDVGANSGLHTIQASRRFRQVHAFEPYPPMFEQLCHSIRINDLGNVVAHQVALSDAAGEVAFRPPVAGNPGTGSLVTDGHADAGEHTINVRAETGDTYLEPFDGEICAIKIDVEGAETRVLDGLGALIRRDRPLLVFEVLQGGVNIATSFAGRLPDDYVMWLLIDIKRKRYAAVPWQGEAGDVVACGREHAGFFGRG
ncbi:MAG: FkbM family methyltransferase [Gammaproteobacteria bacterium]|nr:FkbM family methyltransferase [Gammaproteobacteria bacterium]